MMSYREIISSLLYVLLKELTGQALSKTVEQIKYRKCKLFEKIIWKWASRYRVPQKIWPERRVFKILALNVF